MKKILSLFAVCSLIIFTVPFSSASNIDAAADSDFYIVEGETTIGEILRYAHPEQFNALPEEIKDIYDNEVVPISDNEDSAIMANVDDPYTDEAYVEGVIAVAKSDTEEPSIETQDAGEIYGYLDVGTNSYTKGYLTYYGSFSATATVRAMTISAMIYDDEAGRLVHSDMESDGDCNYVYLIGGIDNLESGKEYRTLYTAAAAGYDNQFPVAPYFVRTTYTVVK